MSLNSSQKEIKCGSWLVSYPILYINNKYIAQEGFCRKNNMYLAKASTKKFMCL